MQKFANFVMCPYLTLITHVTGRKWTTGIWKDLEFLQPTFTALQHSPQWLFGGGTKLDIPLDHST
jgi:hypothetical protein